MTHLSLEITCLFFNLTVIPTLKLQRRSDSINYYYNREAHVKGIMKFFHMNGNDNPANIVTNIWAYNTWFHLMKYLLFWSAMNLFKNQVVN